MPPEPGESSSEWAAPIPRFTDWLAFSLRVQLPWDTRRGRKIVIPQRRRLRLGQVYINERENNTLLLIRIKLVHRDLCGGCAIYNPSLIVCRLNSRPFSRPNSVLANSRPAAGAPSYRRYQPWRVKANACFLWDKWIFSNRSCCLTGQRYTFGTRHLPSSTCNSWAHRAPWLASVTVTWRKSERDREMPSLPSREHSWTSNLQSPEDRGNAFLFILLEWSSFL